MEDQVSNYQSTAILKELSDIKESLAVNTTETANIKINISEIKGDIRDIKADFVGRREFNTSFTDVRNQVNPMSITVRNLVEEIIPAMKNRMAYWSGAIAIIVLAIEVYSHLHH